jgi:hypothetical protein
MSRCRKLDISFVVLGGATTFRSGRESILELRVHRFKKIMLVTTAIGGIGLTGAGVAQAHCADDDQPDAAIENAQFLNCDQTFSSLVTLNAPITVLGDSVSNVGNFCTQVAPGGGSR